MGFVEGGGDAFMGRGGDPDAGDCVAWVGVGGGGEREVEERVEEGVVAFRGNAEGWGGEDCYGCCCWL